MRARAAVGAGLDPTSPCDVYVAPLSSALSVVGPSVGRGTLGEWNEKRGRWSLLSASCVGPGHLMFSPANLPAAP